MSLLLDICSVSHALLTGLKYQPVCLQKPETHDFLSIKKDFPGRSWQTPEVIVVSNDASFRDCAASLGY